MIIYKVTNNTNNKSYIGQTIGYLSIRKSHHKYSAYKSKKNYYFYNALRKYGWDNFTWEVIEKCDNQKQLNEMEFHYIKQYNSLKPNGYNMTPGYDNKTTGYKFTKEQKKALSRKMSGKNNPNYGKGDKIRGDLNPSKQPEVRKKISIGKTGLKRPDIASYRARHFIITNLSNNEIEEVFNMSEWIRNHPNFNYTGVKNVLKGDWKQYHGFHFMRKQ